MTKYSLTVSIAYLASSTDLPIVKEPWLHTRLVNLVKTEDDGSFKSAWYACVYVWDTRQVIQWIDVTGKTKKSMSYAHAIDNGNKLNDVKNLIPTWAKSKFSMHLGR